MLGGPLVILLVAQSLGLVQSAAVDQQRTCYDPRRDSYAYFSTRTAYERVHGNVSRAENSCKPVQIWMLARHGTRYPGETVIKKMLDLPAMRDQIVKNHEEGAGSLCDEDLNRFKSWKLNISEEMADLLVPQGREDLRLLAKRLQRAYPELLEIDANNFRVDDFSFRSTDTERARDSMISFMDSLYGVEGFTTKAYELPKLNTEVDTLFNDTLLLPYLNCPAWQTSFDPILTNLERDKFTAGPKVQSVLRSISRRLGYDRPFDYEAIVPIYEICRYESAWYVDRMSVWCSVFTKEELKILEYRQDLNYYYCCGPGRKMSADLGCPLLSDMFRHFKRLASGSTKEPKGVFYFAHTKTIQVLLAALGIGYEQVPPLASTYASSANRKYRTSILGPFGTNVVAVYHRCDGGSDKVTFHVAERPTTLAVCQNDICDWKSLEREFEDRVNNCNLKKFCSSKISSSGVRSSVEKILIFIVVMIFTFRIAEL